MLRIRGRKQAKIRRKKSKKTGRKIHRYEIVVASKSTCQKQEKKENGEYSNATNAEAFDERLLMQTAEASEDTKGENSAKAGNEKNLAISERIQKQGEAPADSKENN